jgi:3-phosphoshikimate 1-carboxyvinyltransferase
MLIKTIKPDKWKVIAPPSKSYTNRALLVAALASGRSVLLDPLFCDDSYYMMESLKKLGIKIQIINDQVIVYGLKGKLNKPKNRLFVGNAGTAFRFLTTALALCEGNVILDGDKRMRQRPIKDLINALSYLGVNVESKNGYAPLKIHGGSFIGGESSIKGERSSQYISSILLSAPYAENDVIIKVEGSVTSKPYIDITLDIMKHFNVNVENNNYLEYHIKSGNYYKGKKYKIEGDASNASYFFAAAAITEGTMEVRNLPPTSKQGDLKLIEVLQKMGCKLVYKKNSIIISGGELKGIDVDMNTMPDVVPTLAIVACFAKGETNIFNAENLRIKESDRIKAVCSELSKIGAKVIEKKDGMTIIPDRLHGATIETYNDHRIAMSFSIAGLKIPGIKITNPACVNKSFPEYWKVFKKTFY